MTENKIKYRRERLDRGIKARSDSIYFVASVKDVAYLLIPRIAPVFALIILPLFLPVYWKQVFIYTCVYALLSLSWDYLSSCGMFSLGQALFFGVGIYFAAVLNHYFNLPPLIAIPIATLAGGAFCAILLVPILRLRGIYFAMIMLVLPMLFTRIIIATGIFGGTHGLSGLSSFSSQWLTLYLIAGITLLVLFGFRRVFTEDYGLVLSAIRDDDRVVMSNGINIYWLKFQALFVASSVGCLAGAFMTFQYGFAGTSAFALDYSVLPLAAAALGGAGTFAGAFIGSAILVPISESFRFLGGLRIVFYCVVLIVTIIKLPEGLFPYISRKYHQFEKEVETKQGG